MIYIYDSLITCIKQEKTIMGRRKSIFGNTRVYRSSKRWDGSRVVTSMSYGESLLTDVISLIIGFFVNIIVFCFKLIFSVFVFLQWLVKSLINKEKEPITPWVCCGAVMITYFIIRAIVELLR